MGKQSESYVAEVVSVWCCGCVGPRFELDTEGPDRYRSREPLLPAFVTGTTWQTVVKKKNQKKTRTFVQSRGPHPAPLVVLRAVQLFVERYPRALHDFDELQGDVQGDWNQGV